MSLFDVKGLVHLRPYQAAAVDHVERRLAEGARRLLVVSPTGSGKTVIIADLVKRGVAAGRRALIVAHRREIIGQTYEKLCAAGAYAADVGVLMAGDRRRRPGAPVQIASIDTLRHRARPLADVVVVDECHRELSRSYAELRAAYPDALHLGFTATPFRADRRGLGEFFEEILVVATVKQLISDGHLVEPRVFTVPEGALPDLRGVRTRGGDYDQGELEEAVDQQVLVGNLVEHWKRHAGGVRTVAFAVSVKHSHHIVERFREAGVAAEHLDGATPTHERDAMLARLQRGETLVCSNVGVLCEGTDLPPVKCAILARPTKSLALYLQQAGRILRPWQDARAIILDHAGCAREHGLPQDDREYTLDAPPKRRRGAVADVAVRVCAGCQAVLPTATRICPECGFLFASTRDVPGEAAGELVEAQADALRAAAPRPAPTRAVPYDQALQRAYFEQMRALARAKRKDEAWATARFEDRYGTPPRAEWLANAWGAL